MIIPRQIFFRVPWVPFQLHKVKKVKLRGYTDTEGNIESIHVNGVVMA